jgi:nicotinate-nucleotide pyrophosphorylase
VDKWSVLIGGGHNHRMGLFDMMMIKDNHIAAAGESDWLISVAAAGEGDHSYQLQRHVLLIESVWQQYIAAAVL